MLLVTIVLYFKYFVHRGICKIFTSYTIKHILHKNNKGLELCEELVNKELLIYTQNKSS